MSRSVAILLLVILILPLTGHLLFFKLRRAQLRHELKETLEHSVPISDLALIKIPRHWLENPPTHFQWMDKNEFRLNSQMYDIVYRDAQTDTLHYHCLADDAETRLFAQLDNWTAQQSNTDPFQRGQRLQWERLLESLFQSDASVPALLTAQADRVPLPAYTFSCSSWEQDEPEPPPRSTTSNLWSFYTRS